MNSLPLGWKLAKLGDVAEYINGMAFKPIDWKTSGLPIIRIQNLTSIDAYFNYYQGDFDKKYLVENGDLLISWSASLDAYIWRGDKAILNQHIFKVVENNQLITREYLYYAVRETMDEIRSQVHGATMKHITRPEFLAIKIPLPSLEKQRRIASRLNEQLAAVESARKAAEEQLQAARQLPSAYLREIFTGNETTKWKIEKLGNLSTQITDGPHVTPKYKTEGIPFITVRNIVNRKIDLTNVSYISIEVHKEFCKRVKAEKGDILYTKDGTLGIPCVVNTDLDFSFFVSVAVIKLMRDKLNPFFVAYALESPQVLAQVEELGAGMGLKHMVIKSIKALNIPVPSLEDQERIANEIKSKLAETARVTEMLESQLAEINRLPTSLLRKAFEG